jgi:copper chaperone CopZ
VRVTIEKLPGVESAKVSLNEGRAIIQLKPGNAVTMAQIRQSVERNGFTPQQVGVSGEADVVTKGDKLQLRISGTNDTYELASTPHAEGVLQQLRKSPGQRVVVEAIIPAQKDQKATPVIQVNSVKPVTR